MAAKNVFLNTLIVVAVLVGLYVLYLIRDVLILIFASVLVATAIAPVVDRLRSRIGLGQAVLAIYLAIGVCVSTLGYLVLRLLIEQVATLANNLPIIIETLRAYAGSVEIAVLRQLMLDLLDDISTLVSAHSASDGVAEGVLSFTISLVTFGFAFFTVLVIAYYWILERPAIARLVLSFVPADHRVEADDIWREVEARLGGWVRGQLILMGLIAVFFGVGFSIMGIKYALVLAVFAGLVELIPFVGPWIGAIPAVLVALTQSFWLAIAVAIYAAIIQTVEGNIFVPRVLGGTIGISPLVVLIAILVGASLMGALGALLAVPAASAIYVLVQALLLKDTPAKTSAPAVKGARSDSNPPA